MQEFRSQLTKEKSRSAAALQHLELKRGEMATVQEQLQAERAKSARAVELAISVEAINTEREEVEKAIPSALMGSCHHTSSHVSV